MKKWIFLAITAIVASGAGVGYYQWNKGELNIENAKGIPVSSVELYNSFSKDSLAAKAKFVDKVLEVSGIVHEVSKNQQNQTVIQIKTASDGAYVNCTSEFAAEKLSAKSGDSLVLKGICKGMGEGDKDMGILGDVYLIRCHLMK